MDNDFQQFHSLLATEQLFVQISNKQLKVIDSDREVIKDRLSPFECDNDSLPIQTAGRTFIVSRDGMLFERKGLSVFPLSTVQNVNCAIPFFDEKSGLEGLGIIFEKDDAIYKYPLNGGQLNQMQFVSKPKSSCIGICERYFHFCDLSIGFQIGLSVCKIDRQTLKVSRSIPTNASEVLVQVGPIVCFKEQSQQILVVDIVSFRIARISELDYLLKDQLVKPCPELLSMSFSQKFVDSCFNDPSIYQNQVRYAKSWAAHQISQFSDHERREQEELC